jgi:hypothetical protein
MKGLGGKKERREESPQFDVQNLRDVKSKVRRGQEDFAVRGEMLAVRASSR